jgi:hypothetical protein
VIAVPAPISAAFIALVALLYAMLLLGFAHGLRAGGVDRGRRRRWTWGAALGLALWLGLTAALALSDALEDFSARPPRVFLVIAPALLGTLLLGLSPWVGRAASALPGAWIVAAQSFRVAVEAILWLLVARHALPEIMTFTGRNWDVITGLSAPAVAWLGFKRGWPARVGVLLWNLMGLALVTNVVIHRDPVGPDTLPGFRHRSAECHHRGVSLRLAAVLRGARRLFPAHRLFAPAGVGALGSKPC